MDDDGRALRFTAHLASSAGQAGKNTDALSCCSTASSRNIKTAEMTDACNFQKCPLWPQGRSGSLGTFGAPPHAEEGQHHFPSEKRRQWSTNPGRAGHFFNTACVHTRSMPTPRIIPQHVCILARRGIMMLTALCRIIGCSSRRRRTFGQAPFGGTQRFAFRALEGHLPARLVQRRLRAGLDAASNILPSTKRLASRTPCTAGAGLVASTNTWQWARHQNRPFNPCHDGSVPGGKARRGRPCSC